MAITIKTSDNLLNSEWNEEAEFINMKMADADTEQSDDDALVKGLFTVKTSKRFGEKVVGSSAFSSFSTRFAPINPAAPVTRMVLPLRSID